MDKYAYQVIEDNGGGLYLFVMNGNDEVYYAHDGYEYHPNSLLSDLDVLERDNGDTSYWDGCAENTQKMYDELTGLETGWEIVADGPPLTLYPADMGNSAQQALDTTKQETEAAQGRRPIYGVTMRQTAVRLPEEQIEWLKAQQDGISATVRKIIDDAMQE